MKDDVKKITAALIASQLAWESLLCELIAQSAIDPHRVGKRLMTYQARLKNNESIKIAEGIESYVDIIRSVTK